MSATNGHSGNVRREDFAVDLAEHGYGAIGHVDVQLDADANGHHVAIIDAGTAGRWSVDFAVDTSDIELTRVYDEGMRIAVDDLPAWMAPIRERIDRAVRQ